MAQEDRPQVSTADWKTDFSKHSVAYEEIVAGGPGKDGIPALDKPKLLDASQKIDWLADKEPVISVLINGDARAYPLQILLWHEIVNDTVGGALITTTFCPLCNTAIAFDRRLEGATYDFGTTGNLRFSDLVMYDRQTESWWQQATGEAVVGQLTGKKLTPLPASIVSWGAFKKAYSRGKVLSRDTGFQRDYGRNPYLGYDDVNSTPFLYNGPQDGRLAPLERVATVALNGLDVAYPFRVLTKEQVVHDQVGGADIVVFWSKGTASALDRGSISDSLDIGATGVFQANLEGKKLTFEALGDGTFKDKGTGTTWNLLGQGLSGPLAGQQLAPVVHANHFWFSWAVFKPNTRL